MGYITIDSSTSSTTVLVFDDSLKVLKRFQKEHKQIYTKEGYIEHDLEEIFQNLIELVKQASLLSPDPKFISITNQRETFSLFKKKQVSQYIMQLFGNAQEDKKFVMIF